MGAAEPTRRGGATEEVEEVGEDEFPTLQSPKYFSASCRTLDAGASPTTATVSALGM